MNEKTVGACTEQLLCVGLCAALHKDHVDSSTQTAQTVVMVKNRAQLECADKVSAPS